MNVKACVFVYFPSTMIYIVPKHGFTVALKRVDWWQSNWFTITVPRQEEEMALFWSGRVMLLPRISPSLSGTVPFLHTHYYGKHYFCDENQPLWTTCPPHIFFHHWDLSHPTVWTLTVLITHQNGVFEMRVVNHLFSDANQPQIWMF